MLFCIVCCVALCCFVCCSVLRCVMFTQRFTTPLKRNICCSKSHKHTTQRNTHNTTHTQHNIAVQHNGTRCHNYSCIQTTSTQIQHNPQVKLQLVDANTTQPRTHNTSTHNTTRNTTQHNTQHDTTQQHKAINLWMSGGDLLNVLPKSKAQLQVHQTQQQHNATQQHTNTTQHNTTQHNTTQHITQPSHQPCCRNELVCGDGG